MDYEYHRLARLERLGAVDYFDHQGMRPSSDFSDAIEDAITRIRLNPKAGSPVYNHYRFMKPGKYSYTIYYREFTNLI